MCGVKCEALAEEGNGDGIVEDRGLIENLMDSASLSHAESSFAGAAGLHELEFTGSGTRRNSRMSFGACASGSMPPPALATKTKSSREGAAPSGRG